MLLIHKLMVRCTLALEFRTTHQTTWLPAHLKNIWQFTGDHLNENGLYLFFTSTTSADGYPLSVRYTRAWYWKPLSDTMIHFFAESLQYKLPVKGSHARS